jgi:hypothetical protein
METLLKPGDMIRIRNDIDEDTSYSMILDPDNKNNWIEKEMAKPNELVTIERINKGQYKIKNEHNRINLWDYTDEMFDQETIRLLIIDRNN